MDVGEVESWQGRFEAHWAQAPGGDGAHDVHHLRRVWRSARRLAQGESPVDLLVLLAGAYFHDLVNPPKNDPMRAQASALSARAARVVLADLAFPGERLDAVAHAIEAHSYSAAVEPRTLEARILQDADRLEALGAIGLARCFYTGGKMGTALWHPEDPLGRSDRPLDDLAYSIDHFERKLLRLPEQMRTVAGRRDAECRARVLRRYLRQLEAELGE